MIVVFIRCDMATHLPGYVHCSSDYAKRQSQNVCLSVRLYVCLRAHFAGGRLAGWLYVYEYVKRVALTDGLLDAWQQRISIIQWVASNASTQKNAVRKICLLDLMLGRTTTWSFALS